MAKRTFKAIFFTDVKYADRFVQLYGSKDSCMTIDTPDSYWWKALYKNYYGEKVDSCKAAVGPRMTTEEINDLIKYIGLKKKHWNGKICYLYDGQ